jgi:tetratricopeptide (TPR) repeat protein
LDEYYFEDHFGYFWELLDARPYMRAAFSRASCLWVLGRKDEAVKDFWWLLALNTNDNQGVRYRLLPALLSLERYGDAAELTEAYDTKREAVWLFTRALLKFREGGGVSASTKALKKALKQNPYVQAYLTGEKRIPDDYPRQYALGDEDEAILYAEQHLNFWRKTPGAVGWVRAVAKAIQAE